MLTNRFEELSDKYYFSEEHFLEKVEFIETLCTHTEGPKVGEPLVLAPFQKEDILKPAFGLYTDSSCKKRLINKVYIQMPRGNAKTTLLAAVELAVLFNDGERNAHIFNCAGDDEQAGILFNTARVMVEQNQTLSKLVGSRSYRSIIHYGNSFLKKITSKSGTKHGLKPHFWTYDEIHQAIHRDLYDTMSSAMGKRTNPQGWIITTPGSNRASIAYILYEYTRQVNEGIIKDDRFWGAIYAADAKEKDPMRIEIVKAANPLYDYSEPLRDDLERELNVALNDHHYENVFKRLRLGMWTDSITRPWTTKAWFNCENTALNINNYAGKNAYLGVYLAESANIGALAAYFPEDNFAHCHFWIPEDYANELKEAYNLPFDAWRMSGEIDYIPGNLMEDGPIKQKMLEWGNTFNVIALGYEQNFAMTLGSSLNQIAFEYRKNNTKTYKISPAVKELKNLIDAGKFKHGGHQVLNWQQNNIELKTNDVGEVRFANISKDKNIAGLKAICLALYEAKADEAPSRKYNFVPFGPIKIK